jgi:hypothetical protein
MFFESKRKEVFEPENIVYLEIPWSEKSYPSICELYKTKPQTWVNDRFITTTIDQVRFEDLAYITEPRNNHIKVVSVKIIDQKRVIDSLRLKLRSDYITEIFNDYILDENLIIIDAPEYLRSFLSGNEVIFLSHPILMPPCIKNTIIITGPTESLISDNII